MLPNAFFKMNEIMNEISREKRDQTSKDKKHKKYSVFQGFKLNFTVSNVSKMIIFLSYLSTFEGSSTF